jgi:hypothetical protein
MQFKYFAAFMALSSGALASAPSGDDLVFGSVGISQAQPVKQPHGDILETRDGGDKKRVPAECIFTALKRGSFWYWPVKKGGRKACLAAWVSIQPLDVCRHDAFWPEKDINDMVEVMEEQVTKDGLFKRSEVGHWRARFAEFTSAIPDRNAMSSTFEKLLRASEDCDLNPSACKKQNRGYHFRFDDEVWHSSFQRHHN